MLRLLLIIALAATVSTASAQDDPPFPEYPDFIPEASHMGHDYISILTLLDQLEMAPAAAGVPVRAEGLFRIGTDYNKFWLKGEGYGLTTEGTGAAEVQALYSRLVSPYFDALGGIRLDVSYRDGEVRTRPLLALGVDGMTPYWFEIEPAVFLSADGHLSARFEASNEVLITQRLVAQPQAEVNIALQEAPEWGVASGFNDVEAGLRVRYEIRREVAPYAGLEWHRLLGGAADLARASGASVGEVRLVVGIRLWR